MIRDNVWVNGPDTGVTDGGSSAIAYTYNLNCTKAGAKCSGTGNLLSTPVFVQSLRPATTTTNSPRPLLATTPAATARAWGLRPRPTACRQTTLD